VIKKHIAVKQPLRYKEASWYIQDAFICVCIKQVKTRFLSLLKISAIRTLCDPGIENFPLVVYQVGRSGERKHQTSEISLKRIAGNNL
jgi:hypothetical protein